MDQRKFGSAFNSVSGESGKGTRKQIIAFWLRIAGLAVLLALLLKSFVVDFCRVPSESMESTVLAGDFLIVNKIAYGAATPERLPFTSVAIPSFRVPGFTRPRRGDILVFTYPGDPGVPGPSRDIKLVKRCVGLPGDTVQIVDRHVVVNGATLPPPPGCRPGSSVPKTAGEPDARMYPPGLGFNPDNYGPVVVPRKGDVVELTRRTVDRWKSLVVREGHVIGESGDGTVLLDGVPVRSYRIARNYFFVLGDNRENSLDSRYWGFLPETHLIGKAVLVYWSREESEAASGILDRLTAIRWGRIGTIVR